MGAAAGAVPLPADLALCRGVSVVHRQLQQFYNNTTETMYHTTQPETREPQAREPQAREPRRAREPRELQAREPQRAREPQARCGRCGLCGRCGRAVCAVCAVCGRGGLGWRGGRSSCWRGGRKELLPGLEPRVELLRVEPRAQAGAVCDVLVRARGVVCGCVRAGERAGVRAGERAWGRRRAQQS